jgi:hypothetical protein
MYYTKEEAIEKVNEIINKLGFLVVSDTENRKIGSTTTEVRYLEGFVFRIIGEATKEELKAQTDFLEEEVPTYWYHLRLLKLITD